MNEIGHAYKHVQRKLTDQERNALRESLKEHGLRDAITLDQHNDILDGYNREELCQELGIPPHYCTLDVADPVYWIRHNQTARRNLGEKEMRELIVETKASNPEASTRTIAEKLGVSPGHVAKTLKKSGASAEAPVKGKDGKTYKPTPKVNNKFQKALDTYDRRKLAGEPLTLRAISEEAGISDIPVRRAIATRKAQETMAELTKEVALSSSAKARFDAKLAAAKRELELKHETDVRAEARKLNEATVAAYVKRLDEIESRLDNPRWTIMSLAHFKTILACLHPDNAREGHEARFVEAFTLFNDYKVKMVDLEMEKDENNRLKRIKKRVEMNPGVAMPRTVEEMLARRKMAKGKG